MNEQNNEEYSILDLMNYNDNNNSEQAQVSLSHAAAGNDAESLPLPDTDDSASPFGDMPHAWMSKIKRNVSITDITIPGTHDTCARKNVAYSKCQVLSIEEQLNMGIRFLDIRCRHYRNGLPIHHGPVYLDMTFRDVLEKTAAFLRHNPSEFVIMSVKREHTAEGNNLTFEQTLMEHMKRFSDFFYINRNFPNISDVRGKIVLFSRYGDNTIGLNATPWKDDCAFTMPDSKMRVQDAYKLNIFHTSKMRMVEPMLNEANNERAYNRERATWMYINFCSGWNAGSPKAAEIIAKSTNADLASYLRGKSRKRYGIIVMDFPYPELVGSIINQNDWLL